MEEIAVGTKINWLTDGEKDYRIPEDYAPAALLAYPNLRRGRVNAFRRRGGTHGIPGPKKTPQVNKTETGNVAIMQQQEMSRLYLIIATVRMEPRVGGMAMAQSDQTRLVWATNITEAMQKCERYFHSLESHTERYVVLNMAVTEAIQ